MVFPIIGENKPHTSLKYVVDMAMCDSLVSFLIYVAFCECKFVVDDSMIY